MQELKTEKDFLEIMVTDRAFFNPEESDVWEISIQKTIHN